MKIITLDTETTGTDFYHGTKPFLVTTCDNNKDIVWWEWFVNGWTRQPEIPENDIQEIIERIDSADKIIMHNGKFDIHTLSTILPSDYKFPYHKLEDTLIMAHLLASNRPKDLTSLAYQFLNLNIEKHEKSMEDCVKEARTRVRKKDCNSKFRVAKKDAWSDIPSAKDKSWKFDLWLPRSLARHLNLPQEHKWYHTVATYANKDSETTYLLYCHLWDIIRMRKLDKIYRERMKLVKIAFDIEHQGVYTDLQQSKKMYKACIDESKTNARVCTNIAAKLGFDLILPKGGNSKSLTKFCFSKDYLSLTPVVDEKAKTGAPSLNKNSLMIYEKTLDTTSKELLFIKSLKDKRAADTASKYLQNYNRFWLKHPEYDTNEKWKNIRILHPNLNLTGSATLRWTCNNPNSQNIGKGKNLEGFSLRDCFVPGPDRELFSIDAKNIELRIPAYVSGEQALIDLFERENEPPFYGSNHMLIFSIIWEDLWQDAIKKVGLEKVADYCKTTYKATYYQWTKNGNFAVQYQAGDATADKAYHQIGARQKILARFDKQAKLNRDCVSFAQKHGYIETVPDKEIDPHRGYPLLCTFIGNKVKPTIPLSYKVQGTAMWWTARAMVKTTDLLEEWHNNDKRFDGRIVMQVHDEIVFSFPKQKYTPVEALEFEKDNKEKNKKGIDFRLLQSNLWRIKAIAKRMESCGDALGIPTPVGIEWHPNNWAEGIKLQ